MNLKSLLRKIKKLLELGPKKRRIWGEFARYLHTRSEEDKHEINYIITNPSESNVEYLYYSPFNNKIYLSKDYAPIGKFANRVYYEYMGEL